MVKKLLLISNSKSFGKGYLEHCTDEIRDFLNGKKQVLFVPYALKDCDMYADIAGKRFRELGYDFKSIHKIADKKKAVMSAECIFIGGGNTFRLLDTLYREKLVGPITKAVNNGVLYMGSSAGSNLASPTIKTTNDMPIVQPRSFEALNLVPFQINPHFIDTDPASKHMGETREQRIREFHEENDTPVIGLRENSWLRIEGNDIRLGGTTGAKVFLKGKDPVEASQPRSLLMLMKS